MVLIIELHILARDYDRLTARSSLVEIVVRREGCREQHCSREYRYESVRQMLP